MTSSPVRSHSLVHHKQHTQLIESQQRLLKQQPSLSISTAPQRSTSVNHSTVRLVRSSSLSQHSKKVKIDIIINTKCFLLTLFYLL